MTGIDDPGPLAGQDHPDRLNWPMVVAAQQDQIDALKDALVAQQAAIDAILTRLERR